MGAEDSDAFSGLLGALANGGYRTKGLLITNVCLGSKRQCEVGRAYENAVQVRHLEPHPASNTRRPDPSEREPRARAATFYVHLIRVRYKTSS
jgi:hypothetical protein